MNEQHKVVTVTVLVTFLKKFLIINLMKKIYICYLFIFEVLRKLTSIISEH